MVRYHGERVSIHDGVRRVLLFYTHAKNARRAASWRNITCGVLSAYIVKALSLKELSEAVRAAGWRTKMVFDGTCFGEVIGGGGAGFHSMCLGTGYRDILSVC